jgi:heptosyltransferase III
VSRPWPFAGRETAARPDDERFERILVIVTRQIGDVLLTTPLIRAAKLRWPEARIDVLGFAGTLGMLKGNPDVHGLVEVKAGSTWKASLPLIGRLWRRYDLALVAQYTDRAHLYGWVAASRRSGQVPADHKAWWKRLLLLHSVELGDLHSHVVLEKLKLLSPWVRELGPQSVVPPPAAALPAELQAQLAGHRPIVFQVPSLVHYKQWPLRHAERLAAGLAALGLPVVLTGGPSEADRAAVARVAQACPGVIDMAGRLDLNQMAGLLSSAAVYVGPDTSITHLATACGAPVVALFGPIDPKFWGPWPGGWPATQPYESSGHRQQRGNVILLQGPQRCVPCNGAGCDGHPGSRSECLETMLPERVLAEVQAVLRPAPQLTVMPSGR